MANFLTHLECSMTGEPYARDQLRGVSRSGKPLLARYDLAAIRNAITKKELLRREPTMWRYRELLPMRNMDSVVSLGEAMTPMVELPWLASQLKVEKLYVKDEAHLPSGSFKARGLSMAITMAREFGVKQITLPTNGNAGAAAAVYAARANMRSHIFCPEITPEVNVREMALAGANVYKVRGGLIDDCARLVRDGESRYGWFNCATLREPYRLEGKKTMGLELAEQLDWILPDAIFYPTGGGTAVIAMWKAFAEMEALGWIGSKRPRMYAVQAEGCAPIVSAFEQGMDHAPRWDNAATSASGIRVPMALGDFLILRVLRESNGAAIKVTEESIANLSSVVGEREGMLVCPESAAALAGVGVALEKNLVKPGERILTFNCATVHKYPMPSGGMVVDDNGLKDGP